jgi:hypothetical protein
MSSWLPVLLGVLIGLWRIDCPAAFAQSPAAATAEPAKSADGAGVSVIGTRDFRYNGRWTTPFGPARADISTKPTNFLACKPPSGRKFAYALCFFSGPAVGSGGNPALPCKLSADGKSANCTCYKLTSEQYPNSPYLIGINAILNLDVYLNTVKACGHDGTQCGHGSSVTPPACTAANDGLMMPEGNLISVFSLTKSSSYGKGSTQCPTGKYAGCMTAPCHDAGATDAGGNPVVDCRCPIYDGPFEIGQAGMPCDANALTPSSTSAASTEAPNGYVWSAAHNPLANHGSTKPSRPQ